MDKKKAALITGGASGDGLAIAEKFLREQCAVFITGVDRHAAEKKAAELNEKYAADCFGIQYDPFYAKETCKRLFEVIAEKQYVIDKLVCAQEEPGLEQDTLRVAFDDWERIIRVNVTGTYIPARMMAKELAAANSGGTIVFLGSTLDFSSVPGRSAYGSSKGAISSLTRALALDFAKYRVRVNCVKVCPLRAEQGGALSKEKASMAETVIPLGKAVTASQIANAVWYFSSPSSCGVTGASLAVDGGLDCIISGAY